MQENSETFSKIPEVKAIRVLEEYEGFNNYILDIKKKILKILRLLEHKPTT